MKSLTKIGKSMYGNKYTFSGVVPFNLPEIQDLEWGDVIRDNNGKGTFLYVNECYLCKRKFLTGTLIFDIEKCRSCYLSKIK